MTKWCRVFGVIGISWERGRSDRDARLCRGQGVRIGDCCLVVVGFRTGTDNCMSMRSIFRGDFVRKMKARSRVWVLRATEGQLSRKNVGDYRPQAVVVGGLKCGPCKLDVLPSRGKPSCAEMTGLAGSAAGTSNPW